MADFELRDRADRKGLFTIKVAQGSPALTAEEQELFELFQARLDVLDRYDGGLERIREIAHKWIALKTLQTPDALTELKGVLAEPPDRMYTGKLFAVWRGPDDGGRRMQIAARPGAEIPLDYIDLKVALERTESIALLLFPEPKVVEPPRWYSLFRRIDRLVPHIERPKERRTYYLEALFEIAATGLGQDNVRLAAQALRDLQAEIIDREAGIVKNTYLRQLGVNALLLFVALPVAAYLWVDGWPCTTPDLPKVAASHLCTIVTFHKNYLLLVAGAAIGAWLSFSIRRPTLGFRELAVIEEDRLDPRLRLFFVVTLACVVGLLLQHGVIKISIGNFSSENFPRSGGTALLVGLLSGVAEMGLATAVGTRASEFVGRIGVRNQATS